ncbi:MAG: DUF2644 domain-containing protein [Gammaproteobacteria bacterium]|nr:DUF2644 domain-containing protein [Gammaproteobacteria bacterium]
MKAKELITNQDGRLSTTSTIQILGFLVLAGTLLYSVYKGNSDTSTLYLYFAAYCGGSATSKGFVSAYKNKHTNTEGKP